MKLKNNWILFIKLIIYPAALFSNKNFQIGNSERSINFIHNNVFVYLLLVYLKKLFSKEEFMIRQMKWNNVCRIN